MTVVPKIIHQTWKDDVVPSRFVSFSESWRRLHPDWDYRLWTDRELLDLVRARYPALLDIYQRYPHPIMRADFGRYLVLREFGGVYADLDSEAVSSFEPFLNIDRPIFALEPPVHAAQEFIRNRGFVSVVCNAIMVSPAHHLFWDHLLRILLRCTHAANPLDATGPFVMTAACETASRHISPQILPAHVFSPKDKFGDIVDAAGSGMSTCAIHHWAGTWWKPENALQDKISDTFRQWFRAWQPKASQHAIFQKSSGAPPLELDEPDAPGTGTAMSATVSKARVMIAIPVRDGAETLPKLFEQILALDYPRELLSLAFLEGDSSDDSLAKLSEFRDRWKSSFHRIGILKSDAGIDIPQPRWEPAHQRLRRGHIAKVRNELIARLLQDEDWMLWIDADIIEFSPGILSILLETGADIVHPNAVRTRGGPSMDLNAWVIEQTPSQQDRQRWTIDRLYQPPVSHDRLYLSDLRYRNEVALDSVGGTMLLVKAHLHRDGLLFPEEPEDELIETEAFARKARERNVLILGLPNVEIVHAAR